jgi:hypothetical protein
MSGSKRMLRSRALSWSRRPRNQIMFTVYKPSRSTERSLPKGSSTTSLAALRNVAQCSDTLARKVDLANASALRASVSFIQLRVSQCTEHALYRTPVLHRL